MSTAQTPDLSEFIFNKDPRCAAVLLLDVSGSMSGAPIAALNDGLRAFKEALAADDLASKRVEPLVVAFGTPEGVTVVGDFVTAGDFNPPVLDAHGSTPMAEAIEAGLAQLDQRKAAYRAADLPTYRPWMFLITDGESTSSKSAFAAARSRLAQACEAKKVSFFGVGTNEAAMPTLSQLGTRPPLLLHGLDFRSLFVWLSGSLKSVSGSTPGETVPLQKPTWGESWDAA